jgi:RNA polymerase sigma factor (sigma-70 family)
MADTPETTRDNADVISAGGAMRASELEAWFVREVLPLEAALTQFLRKNWRNREDVCDLIQDIYLRVLEAAQKQTPDATRLFVFTIAQNLLIDRVRHEKIVPIETVAELEALQVAADEPATDRIVIARDELRRLQVALDYLPPRSREAILLKQVEGLSRAEIAIRMGVTESTAKWHLSDGLRQLANILYGEPEKLGSHA